MTTSRPAATLTERERNRLLRRVDWRFLLTSPAPSRVLCLTCGELRASCAVFAETDDGDSDSAAEYDLVVLADPSRAILG